MKQHDTQNNAQAPLRAPGSAAHCRQHPAHPCVCWWGGTNLQRSENSESGGLTLVDGVYQIGNAAALAEFAPEQTTTRAMIVSMLARLEGVESANNAGFADVSNEWYATAVNWAANVGVVNGYEDGTFKPNTAITREQLAAILMNYAAYKGEDVSARADLSSYTNQPSTWATEAMQWAVAEELITGVTNDELQPQSSATRAQVAAILQRFLAE